MNENHLKTFSFLVKFFLLLQLVLCINNLKFEVEATRSEFYNRVSNIEAQNRHHEREISSLKTEKVEQKQLEEIAGKISSWTRVLMSFAGLRRSTAEGYSSFSWVVDSSSIEAPPGRAIKKLPSQRKTTGPVRKIDHYPLTAIYLPRRLG